MAVFPDLRYNEVGPWGLVGLALKISYYNKTTKTREIGYIGFVDGDMVIESKGKEYGPISSPIEERHAFSWPKGLSE